MPKLRDLFTQDPTRAIDGVIKADDHSKLAAEVREYVITKELRTKLHDELFEEYVKPQSEKTNGVWISGFFGSGKSHLLKMLSLVLPNTELRDAEGELRAGEAFVAKAADEPQLQGLLKRAIGIPSESILFNIDSMADSVGKVDAQSAILRVFLKVFNNYLGYYGDQPAIAELERDMAAEGIYENFKQHYAEISGTDWATGRTRVLLKTREFEEAFAKTRGIAIDEAKGTIKRYRDETAVSINAFAKHIKSYLDSRGDIERLNFFVDEVGQYINDNTKLMTNLQTVAEDLFTATGGKAWVFVTSQQAIDKVIGEVTKQQDQDFSKIQARFGCKLNLTSSSVDEVIQRRLLDKTDAACAELEDLYAQQATQLKSVYAFSDGGTAYTSYKDAAHFASNYPFVPYQFELFKSALEGLSIQNAFMGRHTAVGERSMLGVAQAVVHEMIKRDVPAGTLVAFDRMYEGIRSTLRTEAIGALLNAEAADLNDFEKRVLRALFLVKFVQTFKPTLRHVSILLLEDPQADFEAHKGKVREALARLEHQNFIQRSTDKYEYLTSEERTIEQQIKHEDVSLRDITERLRSFVFDEVLKERKYRYDASGRSYAVGLYFDEELRGRDAELRLHVTSQYHEQANRLEAQIAATSGRPELRIVLGADPLLVNDLRLEIQTDRYLQKNPAAAAEPRAQNILQSHGHINRERRNAIVARVVELVNDAVIIVSGSTAERYAGLRGQARVNAAFQDLVQKTYRELSLIPRDFDYTNQLTQALRAKRNDLFAGENATLSPAESEILGYVNGQMQEGQQTSLSALTSRFEKRPFGWPDVDTIGMLGRLVGRRRVELRVNGEELLDAEAYARLSSNRAQDQILIAVVDSVDAGQVQALRKLHKDLFDQGNSGVDAKEAREVFATALKSRLEEVRRLRREHGERYGFLEALAPYEQALDEFSRKRHSDYFGLVKAMENALLDAHEEVYQPLMEWWNGEGKKVYDNAVRLLAAQQSNAPYFESEDVLADLREVVAEPKPYTRVATQRAQATLKVTGERVIELLDAERHETREAIKAEFARLQRLEEEWTQLSQGRKDYFRDKFDRRVADLSDRRTVNDIRALGPQVARGWFDQLLDEMTSTSAREAQAQAMRTSPVVKVDPNGATSSSTSPPAMTPVRATAPADVVADEPKAKYEPLETLLRSERHETLKTREDVQAYIRELETRLLAVIGEGKGIIVR